MLLSQCFQTASPGQPLCPAPSNATQRVCSHMHTCVRVSMRVNLCVCACMRVRVHACVRGCVFLFVYLEINRVLFPELQSHSFLFVSVCLCFRVCFYTFSCVRVWCVCMCVRARERIEMCVQRFVCPCASVFACVACLVHSAARLLINKQA